MIYLYSPKRRPGLDDLITSLNATRLSRFDGESFWNKGRKSRTYTPAGSIIVAWGDDLPQLENVRILNGREKPISPADQYTLLVNMGVNTVPMYTDPQTTGDGWSQGVESGKYIPRKYGEKITGYPVVNPDYYTSKIDIEKEVVIHSFDGKSIRAGEKTPTNGRPIAASAKAWAVEPTKYAHPWIRTYAMGWTTDYTVASTPDMRAIAHKTLKILGLTFGSVTLGKGSTGYIFVVKVSTGPNLRGMNTVKAYTKAITKWISTPLEGANQDA